MDLKMHPQDTKKFRKDQILTAISITILFLTAMINWTIYSWLILASVIMLLFAWYFKEP